MFIWDELLIKSVLIHGQQREMALFALYITRYTKMVSNYLLNIKAMSASKSYCMIKVFSNPPNTSTR